MPNRFFQLYVHERDDKNLPQQLDCEQKSVSQRLLYLACEPTIIFLRQAVLLIFRIIRPLVHLYAR